MAKLTKEQIMVGAQMASRGTSIRQIAKQMGVIGFEPLDFGLFNVYFGPVWLGKFVETKRRIVDSNGKKIGSSRRTYSQL